jgi:8-oxo-dGTP pyrophosphatase MutT (NUDIX family)
MQSLIISENDIKHKLAQSAEHPNEFSYPPELLTGAPRPAAVLIPLLIRDSSWHILYTRRTDSLPEHSGQVAFPGGRADPGDGSPEVTALRESFEEIALQPEDVKILGSLKALPTVTNYYVTPVAGKIPWPYGFKLAREEVTRVFTVPLRWLADPNNFEIRHRTVPNFSTPVKVIYFSPFEGEVLWGVSAQITLNLLKALDLI